MIMQLPEAVTSILDQALDSIYGLTPLVEPTVVLVPGFVRDQVQMLSETIGFDAETLTYTLGLFLCYPLGMIMNTLPYGPIRHFFSFFLGMFLLQFTVGVQWIHQLTTSLAVYFMFLTLPRNVCTKVVPIFVMLYMTAGHLHRQYVNYLGWDLDFTGAQMVLTQKLYMMAFNLYDGQQLAAGKDDKAAKKCAPYALKELPNILEYLGYTFCFANVLSGPAYEFSYYRHACDGSHLYTPDGKPRGKLPSNVWPTLHCFLAGMLNLAVFIVGGAKFPLLDPVDPQHNLPVTLQPEFLTKPWPYRYVYMWLGLVIVRQKYYFAWHHAEGANNVWYAGFEGFDDKGQALGWDVANNQDVWGYETATSIQTLSRNWNKKTSAWLTRYVYIRTNGSLLAVYSLSAFWHGFYPGYYLFFLSVPLATVCERLGRKKISPYFSDKKWSPYGIVCMVATSLLVQYLVSAFVLLALDRSWNNWKSHYFFGHISCIVFYFIFSQLPTPKKKEKTQ